MKIIGTYTNNHYGNDCTIYKCATLSEFGGHYQVMIGTKVVGWSEDLYSEIKEFKSEKKQKIILES